MDWSNLRLTWEPRMLSILRIMVGLLFMEHGTQKSSIFRAAECPAIHLLPNPGLAGVLELVGGILIAIGLFTRPVAFILSGEMAFAYFMSHAPRGFFPIGMGGTAANWRSSTASSSCISSLSAPASGASITSGHPGAGGFTATRRA